MTGCIQAMELKTHTAAGILWGKGAQLKFAIITLPYREPRQSLAHLLSVSVLTIHLGHARELAVRSNYFKLNEVIVIVHNLDFDALKHSTLFTT